MQNVSKKRGIALLITVMFVILISAGIAYGLKQMNSASKTLTKEMARYEMVSIVDDVLRVLQNSTQLQSIATSKSVEDLNHFLSNFSSIPLDIDDRKVIISVKSARGKYNINNLNRQTQEILKNYFANFMVDGQYVDILRGCMKKYQAQNEYNNYYNILFDENPNLFRDYIVSKKHLDKINRLYVQEYRDENLKSINFDKLFTYENENNIAIDLNHASAEVWQFILQTTSQRAESLVAGEGLYKSAADLGLSEEEMTNLQKFKTSFYEPYLSVSIKLITNEDSQSVSFEYDILSKKGKNFEFEI